MDEKILPGAYWWQELKNEYKEAIIMSYHREMLSIGYDFTIEQVRDIFMEARPVIEVNSKNEYGIQAVSKPAMEFFISLEFYKKK